MALADAGIALYGGVSGSADAAAKLNNRKAQRALNGIINFTKTAEQRVICMGGNMQIHFRKATPEEAERVYDIVRRTKDVIYPDYYTRDVIDFINRYYTAEIIKNDIELGATYVLVKDGTIIGTGSRIDNHILRVYVLPEYQGQGVGGRIMDELEKEIFAGYDHAELEASLPACIFYENRGYQTVRHVKEDIGGGKCMIYEIMRKSSVSRK